MSPAALPPLPRLLLAYAPASERPWQSLCWALDQRLAAVAQRGGDPMIAAIRLAWWDSVLVTDDQTKGSGEPLVEQWRALAGAGAGGAVEQLIEGWRLLLSDEPMTDEALLDYGTARGGGLFALIGGPNSAAPDALTKQAGCLWALWDLAAHVRDEALADQTLAVAQNLAMTAGIDGQLRALPRPLRLLMAALLPDVRAGRATSDGFTLRHYGRLLMASLRG